MKLEEIEDINELLAMLAEAVKVSGHNRRTVLIALSAASRMYELELLGGCEMEGVPEDTALAEIERLAAIGCAMAEHTASFQRITEPEVMVPIPGPEEEQ